MAACSWDDAKKRSAFSHQHSALQHPAHLVVLTAPKQKRTLSSRPLTGRGEWLMRASPSQQLLGILCPQRLQKTGNDYVIRNFLREVARTLAPVAASTRNAKASPFNRNRVIRK